MEGNAVADGASPVWSVRARWVFPVVQAPRPHAYVVVRGGRIAAIQDAPPSVPTFEFPEHALLPGFVNCHTHLEFSSLPAPLGQPGMPLPDWIREVVAWRRSVTAATLNERVLQGYAECRDFGTVLVGEIATGCWPKLEPGAWPRVFVFRELLGLAREKMPEHESSALEHLASGSSHPAQIPGLSPHAPYTISLAGIHSLSRIASRCGAPVAMHLAESVEELELLRTHKGPFRELLEGLGAWHPREIPLGTRPLDFLRALSAAPRVLVVHGNYLDDESITWLGARRSTMSVICCPRTHAYFHHAPYRFEALRRAGVRVALGTDSRASNPDLSIFEELRFLAKTQPALPPGDLVRMGTLDGAAALGADNELGSLEPGKLARFALVRLRSPHGRDPYTQLFEGTEVRCWSEHLSDTSQDAGSPSSGRGTSYG